MFFNRNSLQPLKVCNINGTLAGSPPFLLIIPSLKAIKVHFHPSHECTCAQFFYSIMIVNISY